MYIVCLFILAKHEIHALKKSFAMDIQPFSMDECLVTLADLQHNPSLAHIHALILLITDAFLSSISILQYEYEHYVKLTIIMYYGPSYNHGQCLSSRSSKEFDQREHVCNKMPHADY